MYFKTLNQKIILDNYHYYFIYFNTDEYYKGSKKFCSENFVFYIKKSANSHLEKMEFTETRKLYFFQRLILPLFYK